MYKKDIEPTLITLVVHWSYGLLNCQGWTIECLSNYLVATLSARDWKFAMYVALEITVS